MIFLFQKTSTSKVHLKLFSEKLFLWRICLKMYKIYFRSSSNSITNFLPYRFMQQASKSFLIDPTIWCVSGYNAFSHPHTGRDPAKLYRGTYYPVWGWMMPRSVIEEILPKWLPQELVRIEIHMETLPFL